MVLVASDSAPSAPAPAAVAALPTARSAFTVTPQPSPTQKSLTPTWTLTPWLTATVPPTATLYPMLYPTTAAQMDKIEQQAADLRGLSSDTTVPRRLIRKTDFAGL